MPRRALAAAPRLAPLVLALLAASPSCHAQWKFTPTMGLSQTWTDNISLQPDHMARSQWVTDYMPGFTLVGNTPRLKVAAMHEWHYFAYSGARLPHTFDSQRRYQATADARVVDDLLYLDASAAQAAQAVSAFGPQVNGNLWAMGNRVELKTWRISPWVQHRFGRSATATARYTRDSVDAGRNPLLSSEGESVAASLASGPAFDDIGWSLDYNRQDLDNKLAGSSSSEMALGTLRLRLSRTFSATASAGYDRHDFESLGGRNAGRNWSAGFAWAPSSRTSLQAAWGRRYFGPSGSLAASHRSRRSVWSIHYGDAITTSRQQFLLPASIDTATMLDKLFMTTFPDPVARRQAVETYMQVTGLPHSLADSVNYFSNRYLRQKQLQAAAAFNGARNRLVLSAFHTRREALSVHQSDSELLGSQLSTLNDNTRQSGGSAVLHHRLSPRTDALLSLTAGRTESLTTGRVDNNRVLRLGLTRRLGGGMSGALEMRHVRGGLDALTTRTYTENAVSATLSIQLL